ncbi:MAG: NAD(P)/FAD-dependent oxidoreductase [Syntrophomonadaceae bacterium]|jgi:thioredoxin reductase (NADPH)|nr:NAD(P)/FAD-dependent oxidoreductase [Syntrophomonadaceae bacterium]
MRHSDYDVVILGCGPAGLSAAVNATIRNKKVLVIGGDPCSPPMHRAQKIDNYLGLPGIRGAELLERFMDHARAMDIEIVNGKVDLVTDIGTGYQLLLGDEFVNSKTIIIATGVPYKSTLPREEEMLGKGLGYCATCDGPLYRDRNVMLISHNEEGESEADFMAQLCREVYYVPLYKKVGAMDPRVKVLQERPKEIIGEDQVTGVRMANDEIIPVDGLFILGGETSPSRLVPGLEMEDRHIKVNRKQETNLRGILAAGDCTGKPYQVAKSIGEGQVAGLQASLLASQIRP